MFLLISFAIACILAIVLHGTTRRFVRNRLVSEAAARAASALGRAGELFPLVSRVAALAWAGGPATRWWVRALLAALVGVLGSLLGGVIRGAAERARAAGAWPWPP